MKPFLSVIVLFGVVFTSTAPRAEEHPLGTSNIFFCNAFVKKVSSKVPMPYKDFIKLTDGEGMPISPDRRHWDGKNNSYLSVLINYNFVKGGIVTCPNGDVLPFGAWDVPE